MSKQPGPDCAARHSVLSSAEVVVTAPACTSLSQPPVTVTHGDMEPSTNVRHLNGGQWFDDSEDRVAFFVMLMVMMCSRVVIVSVVETEAVLAYHCQWPCQPSSCAGRPEPRPYLPLWLALTGSSPLSPHYAAKPCVGGHGHIQDISR